MAPKAPSRTQMSGQLTWREESLANSEGSTENHVCLAFGPPWQDSNSPSATQGVPEALFGFAPKLMKMEIAFAVITESSLLFIHHLR